MQPDHPVPEINLPAGFRNDKPAEADPASLAGALTDASATSDKQASDPPTTAKHADESKSEEKPSVMLPTLHTDWWRRFNSPELNRLIDEAEINNHDLGAAIARIEQAQAQIGIAGAALAPTVQATGLGQSDSPAGGPGTRVFSTDGKAHRLYEFSANASYELDFWGKNRSTADAAQAALQSSIYDRDTVALTLVGSVATAYLQYLVASDRVTVAKRNADNMAFVLDIVEKRGRIGEGTDIEIQQQATALAQARAAIPPLAIQREQARDQLATLVGIPPEELRLSEASLDQLSIPTAPATVPSELMAARPDIRKAEADIIGANANIGVARAQLLPSFTLQAQIGQANQELFPIFSPASFLYLFAANVSQTLFDNGKLLSQIDLSKAQYKEKVETYRQAILNALRDVEDALAAARLSEEEEKADVDASTRAQAAYALIQKAFRTGTVSYLTILDIERTQYQAEDARVQARFDRLNAAASLFRSLGGGLEVSAGS